MNQSLRTLKPSPHEIENKEPAAELVQVPAEL